MYSLNFLCRFVASGKSGSERYQPPPNQQVPKKKATTNTGRARAKPVATIDSAEDAIEQKMFEDQMKKRHKDGRLQKWLSKGDRVISSFCHSMSNALV